MTTLSKHFLLRCFTDYYQELAAARLAISRGILPEHLSLSEQNGSPSNELLVSSLFRKLRSILSEQQQSIRSQGTISEQKDYLTVLYILVALSDEQLLFATDWEFDELWQKKLLEVSFFETANAGSEFYTQLEKVLDDRSTSANRSDVAAVFLMALSLGFRGQYQSAEGEKLVSEYRDRLFSQLKISSHVKRIFDQAYRPTLREVEDVKRHRVAALSRWKNFAWLALGVYLTVSSAVWVYNSELLQDKLSTLNSAVSCDSQISASAQSGSVVTSQQDCAPATNSGGGDSADNLSTQPTSGSESTTDQSSNNESPNSEGVSGEEQQPSADSNSTGNNSSSDQAQLLPTQIATTRRAKV